MVYGCYYKGCGLYIRTGYEPLFIDDLLLFILAVLLLLLAAAMSSKQQGSVPSLPAIPDYTYEISYWQNESCRIDAEMQARAKRAEQEEFEHWLRRRRNGQ